MSAIAAKLRIARAVDIAKRHGLPTSIVSTADLELLLSSATDTSAEALPSAVHRDEVPSSTPSDRGRAAPELDQVLREYSIPPECVHTAGGRS